MKKTFNAEDTETAEKPRGILGALGALGGSFRDRSERGSARVDEEGRTAYAVVTS
jgi:hypothetical protein